jgi:uncharacterized Ntn-hydrolase superfamily protein
MTWSILARDPETGLLGMAVASRFFAVGGVCPWSQGGTGILSTQALVNPCYGPRGLALLREGIAPRDVCDILTTDDPGASQRQIHVMNEAGAAAAHTGGDCVDWCGQLADDQVSVAGNMLAGPQVLARTLESYQQNPKLPIVDRLLAAMVAGEAAGGDKRGRQSAALVIQGPEPYRRLDIRADDHADPLAELARLHAVARERFIPFSASFPCHDRPYGVLDRAVIERIIERDAGKPLQRTVALP